MRLLEVFTPEINSMVRYRVLGADDIDYFVEAHRAEVREDYMRLVMESVIFNLKSDVTEALRKMPKSKGRAALDGLYNGCIMLNPLLDLDTWLKISNGTRTIDASDREATAGERTKRAAAPRRGRLTKAKFLSLEQHLKSKLIGQDEAIEEVSNALKRSVAGLNDEQRPLGVFLFAGASGVGKTHLARELQKYLFGDVEIVRVDCGEYQHKHENQKLLGAPPGYLGHDEGGQLTNAINKNPHTVVLLDEVEKAHPDMWNTFLRVFDEGILTDSQGRTCNFRDAIIIMTTNLGNGEVVENMLRKGVGFGQRELGQTLPPRKMVETSTRDAIRKHFRPEFINRIDKIITFNHLTHEMLTKIAELELMVVAEKLAKRGYTFSYDESVVEALIKDGWSPVQGARGLAQVRRDRIENPLADVMLAGRYVKGTVFQMSHDGNYRIQGVKPRKVETSNP